MKLRKFAAAGLIFLLALTCGTALAGSEHALGKPLVAHGLIIQPVYLQSVEMAPAMPGVNKKADIHLELDIHADKSNKRGFQPGSWIPALTVSYEIRKKGSDWSTFGTLMAMVANDGPHYGANVNLDGPGKYTASFKIAPPPYTGFLRHTTKDTGVAPWWPPFKHAWTFTYIGVGKKGGY
ncbi:iron transporter [Salinisphaera sp.]|uniref:iron transporter n=1 Tax=Salinisphaera sp. TaxID=1914330 RepID=UPI002D79B3A2|nr:iron transporter [Salinisphaera sp.]HET7315091.1 iron transporter [Salinisphaera sp.]